MSHAPVIILGSGPAGYTAAIYAARAGLSPLVLQGEQPGGQLTITTDVDNYPGFAETIQGPWLMDQMRDQALACGARIEIDTIVSVDLEHRPFTLEGELGDVYTADCLVIATGATAKWLGIPGEEAFRGQGVSACATCDGPFFKNKKVAVIGGGNTAVEEALYLSRLAESVTLIHRRDSLRAEKLLQERLLDSPNINVLWNQRPVAFSGEENGALQSVTLQHVETGQEHSAQFDGVFVAIGHSPNTGLFKGQLETDEEGYLETRPGTPCASLPGVYAAGDVQDKIYRQAVTAAASGCQAALEAERFLAGH